MINVLHVISDTNLGGAGIHVSSLVNSLNKNDFNVFVACPKNAQILNLIDSTVNIIQVESMQGNKSFDFNSIYELIKIIKQNNINIVHTHAHLSARIAAKICNVKIVYTRHTPSNQPKLGSIKWHMNRLINLFLCHKVIGVSNYISKQVKESGIPDSMIETIYNGIDISHFIQSFDKDEIKKIYGLQNQIVLLQIARLEEIKGHKYLLHALAEIIKENYDVKLLLVGSGSLEEELKKLTNDLNIKDNVIFTGTIKDIRHILSICDIFILPSLNEALGISLIEAMCMSKPCIASNVDGIPEVVENKISGILIDPKNIEEFKNAIIKLLNDSTLRENMGIEGNKIVLEKFSLVNMVTKVENIYYNLNC